MADNGLLMVGISSVKKSLSDLFAIFGAYKAQ